MARAAQSTAVGIAIAVVIVSASRGGADAPGPGVPSGRLPVFSVITASPVLASFGAGESPRIIILADQTRIAVLGADGRVLPGWPLDAETALTGPPFVMDLDGDGRGEVFAAHENGGIFRWNEKGVALPLQDPGPPGRHFTAPVAARFQNDTPVLVGAALDGTLAVWERTGKLRGGWPRPAGSPLMGRCATASVDGVAGDEIIFGDASGGLHVWSSVGTELEGWPLALPAPVRVTASALPFGAARSCPVVATFDADGWVRAFDVTATTLPGWPAETRGLVNEPLAVGDLEHDGTPELVVTHRGGTLMVVRSDGVCDPRWPRDAGAQIMHGPLLSDVTGDSLPEIVFVTQAKEIWALHSSGEKVPGWPRELPSTASGTPAAGDLDADGYVELVVGLTSGEIIGFETDGIALPGPGSPRADTLRVWQNLPTRSAFENAVEIQVPAANTRVTLELLDDEGDRAALLIDGRVLPSGRTVIPNPGHGEGAGVAPGEYIARLSTPGRMVDARVLVIP